METRPPVPPFSREDAITKVRAAEDAWNTRDPQRVAGAYSVDSVWRNRSEFFSTACNLNWPIPERASDQFIRVRSQRIVVIVDYVVRILQYVAS